MLNINGHEVEVHTLEPTRRGGRWLVQTTLYVRVWKGPAVYESVLIGRHVEQRRTRDGEPFSILAEVMPPDSMARVIEGGTLQDIVEAHFGCNGGACAAAGAVADAPDA